MRLNLFDMTKFIKSLYHHRRRFLARRHGFRRFPDMRKKGLPDFQEVGQSPRYYNVKQE